MSYPEFSPASQISSTVLPETGSEGSVLAALPFGIYQSTAFLSGAADQVTYVYRRLGGDVLDLEITEDNVYSAYEEACLEYSYLINIHQAKNVLGDVLGSTTGSFDQDGNIIDGAQNVESMYPKFGYAYSRKVSDAVGSAMAIGGSEPVYSASFVIKEHQQDYDLQEIISTSVEHSGAVGNNRVLIKRVFYKTPHSMWRFYGYYGGLNVVGNLQNYGQWADDSSFQVIPAWQNKMQAGAFEDHLYTRTSHYSFQVRNNKLRIFPAPTFADPHNFWVEFMVDGDAWDEDPNNPTGVTGVNNMNTIPFENVPYESINSIGKQWIRRFGLALIKETLGQVRGKFTSGIPFPNGNVTLNASELLTQAKDEQEKLREELKTILDELTYAKLAERDATIMDNTLKVNEKIPLFIFRG
jgi:hypothetical protein